MALNVVKDELWTTEEITAILDRAGQALDKSNCPEELRGEGFKVALTLASQVTMSAGPIVTPGRTLQ